MINAQLSEAVHGILLVVVGAWLALFVRYIVVEFSRRDRSFGQAWRGRAAAIATMLFLLGYCIQVLAAWRWRHYSLPVNDEASTLTWLAGVTISTWGCVCGIRYFAPNSWGNWPWIVAPLAGAVFGLGMAYAASGH